MLLFADLGFLKNWGTAPLEDRVSRAIDKLRSMTRARPRKSTTLKSTLHALFRKQLDEKAIDRIYHALVKKGIVSADANDTLTYRIEGKLKAEN